MRYKVLLVCMLLSCFFLLFCAETSRSESDVAQKWKPSTKWKSTELVGYNLKLVSDTDYISYRFNRNDVAAIEGAVGGPLCAPAYRWHIDKSGVLILTDYDETLRYTKLRETSDMVEAKLNGRILRFKRTKIVDK